MLLDNNSDQNPQSQILCWNSDSAIIQLKFPGFYSNLFEHEGKNYSKISLRKHSCKADSFGKPLLPEIIYNYIIPRDCRFRISVREHSDTTLYNYTIYPWQNTLDNNHRFYLDRNAYDGDIYCQNPIENIDYSHWRELEFLSLRFNPIGYFTSGDSIIVTKSLTLKIDFIDKGKEYSDLSPMTMKLGDHIFANSKHFINTYRSYSPDNSPAIAIICPNIFEISAKRLARWRQNEGYRVKLSKTSDIPGGTSSYIDSTIIDGGKQSSCIRLHNSEQNAVIQGFSITNGIGYDHVNSGAGRPGGGVAINTPYGGPQTVCTITNCKIFKNKATTGAGIYCHKSTLHLSRTKITENYGISGGGLSIQNQGNVTFDIENKLSLIHI